MLTLDEEMEDQFRESINCKCPSSIIYIFLYENICNPAKVFPWFRQSVIFSLCFLLVQTIVDVYTVELLKKKVLQNEGKSELFYGIIFAYISTLNIDNETTKTIRNRWYVPH